MDFVGTLEGEPFAGGEGRDQMVELGSGRLVPGFEEQLQGAVAGEERTVSVTFPDDYGAPELAGQEAAFAVTVKEVKAKELPPLDDDLAIEAGFDTLDELRDDIRSRLRGGRRGARIEAEFREAALDAAVANATVEIPDTLARGALARAVGADAPLPRPPGHLPGDLPPARGARRGGDRSSRASRTPSSSSSARRSSPRSSRPRAIEASDEEVMEAIERAAPAERTSPKKLLDRMRSSGRLEGLKSELAQRKAFDLLTGSARPITVEQAKAREKLWTPGRAGESHG